MAFDQNSSQNDQPGSKAVAADGLHYAPDPSTLSQLYQHLAQRLSSEYRLRYRTPRDVRDGTRRSVDVRVRVTGTGDVTAPGSYLVGMTLLFVSVFEKLLRNRLGVNSRRHVVMPLIAQNANKLCS